MDWTLWGSHPAYADGSPIKITNGALRACKSEQRYRERCGGWSLALYRQGVTPAGLRALATTRATPNEASP